MKRQNISLIFSISVLLILIPCTGTADFQKTAIAVLLPEGDLLSDEIFQGMSDAAGNYSLSLSVIRPDKLSGTDEQVVAAFNALAQKPSALLLCPTDSKMFRPVIKAAVSDSIPVFIIHSPVKSDEQTWFIGSDNARIGILAAEELASRIDEKGFIAVFSGDAKDPASIERSSSFIKQIEDSYQDIDVQWYYPSADISVQELLDSILVKNSSVRGLFATDGKSTSLISSFLKDSARKTTVPVIGIDGGDEMYNDIETGAIQVLYLQNPYMIGYRTGEVLSSFFNDGIIEPETYVDFKTLISLVSFPSPSSSLSDTKETFSPEVYPVSQNDALVSETQSYNERLREAAGGYDFLAMSEANANSYQNKMDALQKQQYELAHNMSLSYYESQLHDSGITP
ncbi:MAG: substrate-binding domain-containing protein [Methanospirillaceae archaeon]|nr:substrate-binding domain-containing protein [Methanospirillaceae archaeon]